MLTKNQQYILQEMGIPVWQERQANALVSDTTAPLTDDWEQLKQEALGCTKCALSKTRKNVVFGAGNPKAELMIIGEAPGANEDRLGEPFVGKAGQLLDAMLTAMGLSRSDVYICNILKCRPPDNRDPTPSEIATCTPYLERQIAAIQPKRILVLGRIAAHYLLGVETPLGKLRGQFYPFGPTAIDLLVTYHPAYLLRNPRDKNKAYKDLLKVTQPDNRQR